MKAARRSGTRSRRTRAISRPRPALVILMGLIGCGIAVIAAVVSGTASPRLLWLEAIVLGLSAMCVNKLRPENDAAYVSEFAKQVAGDEPVQLHCRVDGGYGIDGVLVATDQRLIYSPPERSGRSREVLWTVPYCDITSLTTRSREVGVLLLWQAGGDEYQAGVFSDDAKALSEVVSRNRLETAEPLVIRLGDNSFKKMLGGVRPSSREGRNTRDS